jgi:hypothetical protein
MKNVTCHNGLATSKKNYHSNFFGIFMCRGGTRECNICKHNDNELYTFKEAVEHHKFIHNELSKVRRYNQKRIKEV